MQVYSGEHRVHVVLGYTKQSVMVVHHMYSLEDTG